MRHTHPHPSTKSEPNDSSHGKHNPRKTADVAADAPYRSKKRPGDKTPFYGSNVGRVDLVSWPKLRRIDPIWLDGVSRPPEGSNPHGSACTVQVG